MNETSMSASDARPAEHPPVAVGRIGVLIVNLGTPDATDYWSMRRYLKEFLSDRRAPRRAAEGGLRAHPDRAALSAVFGRDLGDRCRQGVRCAQEDALAAGGADRAAVA